jgi:riboflavin synthase alpha subunit
VFTGIVTQRARVVSFEGAGDAPRRLVVRLERDLPGLAVGDSVALDGVCLTVVAVGPGAPEGGPTLAFDVVPETLRRTTLARARPGSRWNVEGALRAGDPLGGHLVQGHVDGVGRIETVERRGGDVRVVVSLPEGLAGAVIPKGSVAVDGVSLTVGECEDDRFSVYLVPRTLEATGLSEKAAGDPVNLEADVVGRWVGHHVRRALSELPTSSESAKEAT